MQNIELDEEMEMPCQCRCGKWFDLNDGYGSEKWCPNEVICKSCHDKEEKEIERDEEIEDAKNALDDAVYTVNEKIKELTDLGQKYSLDLDNNILKVTGPEGDK